MNDLKTIKATGLPEGIRRATHVTAALVAVFVFFTVQYRGRLWEWAILATLAYAVVYLLAKLGVWVWRGFKD